MVNREIIRLKVVQLVYSATMAGDIRPDKVEKELLFSLQKTFDLYHSMLQLMVDLYRVGCKRLDAEEARVRRLGEGSLPPRRFADNRFMKQLAENEELCSCCQNQKLGWMDEEEFLVRIYRRVTESSYYRAYLQNKDSYENDQRLWREIYRREIIGNAFIDDVIEGQSLYWNDDRYVVDSFVLKTIKMFQQDDDQTRELIPQFRDDSDRMFAVCLMRATLKGAEEYQNMIASNARGWNLERLASMDVVIMQTALAEIINFPDIAVGVTMSEYIEVAKYYSTPQSAGYINGLLDAIVHKLAYDGIINKEVK